MVAMGKNNREYDISGNRATQSPDGEAGQEEVIMEARVAAGLIERQSQRVDRMFNVFSWSFCLIWGVAWLIGYLVLGLATSANAGVTPIWAWICGAGMLLCAVVLSIVVAFRGLSGYRASSERSRRESSQGVIYGWTWFLAFSLGMSALGMISQRYELNANATASLYCVVTALLVGALYMIGGALWGDKSQFVVGVWMLMLTLVLPMFEGSTGYIIMGVLGGGGMILEAVWALFASRKGGFADGIRAGKTEAA